MKPGAALLSFAFVVLSLSPASAALTSSEKAQVRDFVASARPGNAGRVRSLVARTDLTSEESIAALRDAVAPVPFTGERAAFLRDLVFGAASEASRPLVARAVVRAVLARADAVFEKAGAALEREPRALAELGAIYAFVDEVAADTPERGGIGAASRLASANALGDHVDRHARWLKGQGEVPAAAGPMRAQAQLALYETTPEGRTKRVDAASRLGLTGARKQILIEWGVLLADSGALEDKSAEAIRAVLARLPGARVDLSLVYVGAAAAPLRARGQVAKVEGRVAASDANPFPAEVAPAKIDPAASVVARDLAVLAAKRALDGDPELRKQTERDAAAAVAATGEGRLLGNPRAPSVEHVLGAALHLLVLDAPRTVDLAMVRLLGGRPQSAALLSDAVAALAVGASDAEAAKLSLGKTGGAATLTAVKRGPHGGATELTLDGQVFAFERPPPSFAVTRVTRGGVPVTRAHLSTARPSP
jgi:hypothetical protein